VARVVKKAQIRSTMERYPRRTRQREQKKEKKKFLRARGWE